MSELLLSFLVLHRPIHKILDTCDVLDDGAVLLLDSADHSTDGIQRISHLV
jgi:hypothetical protein